MLYFSPLLRSILFCASLVLDLFLKQSMFLRSIFCSTVLVCDSVWCSAQLSHPYVNGTFVRMWWQGSTKTEARETGSPPLPLRKWIPAQASGGAVRAGAFTVAGASTRLGCRPARPTHDGPWHVICVQEGCGFVTDSSLQEKFHAVTQHHCAVLLNKDTFEYDTSCTPCLIPCSLRHASWALEGMAVTSKFRRALDSRALILLSQTSTSITNALKDVRCASRCCCCLKLGAVVLTGEFNKAVERETSCSDGERRTSPMEVAFRHTNVPWPASAVTPLRRVPVANTTVNKWPDCCGFMVLPESSLDGSACGTGPSMSSWQISD